MKTGKNGESMREVSPSAEAQNWPARALAGKTEDHPEWGWMAKKRSQKLARRTPWLQEMRDSP